MTALNDTDRDRCIRDSTVRREQPLLILTVLILLLLSCSSVYAELTMVSWGGAYTRSQILAFVRPYQQQTGKQITVIDYSGGLTDLRKQVRSLNFKWDIIDLELSDALRACEEGLLEPISPQVLEAPPDGSAVESDFIAGSLTPCAIGTVIWSTVIAFDPAVLPETPQRLEDFFDTERFPGHRGLRKTPKANLEWALLADGVPADRIYATLETEAGLQRAFTKLNSIKPLLIWWVDGIEAPYLLESKQVVMTSAYNGRIEDANAGRGAALEILWDRQIWNIDLFGIPRDNPNAEQALDFIRFATRSDRLAEQARHIPYGPVRKSALQLMDSETRLHLPTASSNFDNALQIDARWWAQHFNRINHRFQKWLERPLQVPKNLPR